MSSGIFSVKNLGKFLNKKITIAIVVLGIIGIVLILLSDLIHFSPNDTQTVSNPQDLSSEFEIKTAERLENIISHINGVGRVKVMVTVESGVENVYEKDNKETKDQQNESDSNTQIQHTSESSHVIIDSDNGAQQALLTKQLQPEILGVVVVCDGGGNPEVKEAVINTVSTALGITTNQICVNEMQPNSK